MKNKRNKNFYLAKLVVLLIFGNITIALAEPAKKTCADFDRIALQLAVAQNKMNPPISLDQVILSLGPKKPTSISTTTSYSWVYRKRVLLVVIDEDRIANKMLTGTDDGSPTSRKMEQINAKLKSATSIWTVDDIQKQLGKGFITRNKFLNYNWYCGNDVIAITTNQNNKIISAKINYLSDKYAVDSRLGTNHPEWDIENEYSGKILRSWNREYSN